LKFQIEKITREVNGVSTTETNAPNENYFKEYIFGKFGEELKIDYKTKSTNYQLIAKTTGDHLILDYNKSAQPKSYYIYDFEHGNLNFPLITFNSNVYEEETRNIYENFKTKREKQILLDVLKIVNPKIVNIEFRERFDGLNSFFLISLDDQEDFVKLNTLGDGFKRIFYIILKTISLRGKRIMIDEIEIGIHYSKLKDFWVHILNVCHELDVQLFASTHSQECIEDFVSALEIVACQDKARLIKLKQDTEDLEICVTTYLYRHIKAGLNSNLKMLGL
jgi:AAA15 family ATPase/GTPase